MVENEIDLKIKCLRSDNGGGFTSDEFNEFYETRGIRRHFSVERIEQNGVAERKNKNLQEATRTTLNETKLLDTFWREETYTTVYILNRG